MPTLKLKWEEFRSRMGGYGTDDYTGLTYIYLKGLGSILVNRRVMRKIRRMGGFEKIPDDYNAWVSINGGRWLYRVASDDYVDVPAGLVMLEVRNALEGSVLDGFGKWSTGLKHIEGADYGEVVASLGEFNTSYLGKTIIGVRVTWGNDGYTAFTVTSFVGVLACINGLVQGMTERERIFHTHAVYNNVNDVLRRIRNAVKNTLEELGNFHISTLEEFLLKTPVNRDDLAKYLNYFGPEFARLWSLYSQRYGENALALAQALAWFTTHAGETKANKATSILAQLTTPP